MPTNLMIDVTFLPGKNAPRNILPVTYHINLWSTEASLKIAKELLQKEHAKHFKYYKDEDIVIAETRIINQTTV